MLLIKAISNWKWRVRREKSQNTVSLSQHHWQKEEIKVGAGYSSNIKKILLILRIYYWSVAAKTLCRHAYNKTDFKPGVVACTYNPRTQESETGESQIWG